MCMHHYWWKFIMCTELKGVSGTHGNPPPYAPVPSVYKVMLACKCKEG